MSESVAISILGRFFSFFFFWKNNFSLVKISVMFQKQSQLIRCGIVKVSNRKGGADLLSKKVWLEVSSGLWVGVAQHLPTTTLICSEDVLRLTSITTASLGDKVEL